jgi:hypothetical protein
MGNDVRVSLACCVIHSEGPINGTFKKMKIFKTQKISYYENKSF